MLGGLLDDREPLAAAGRDAALSHVAQPTAAGADFYWSPR
jgi:hypothetical protein